MFDQEWTGVPGQPLVTVAMPIYNAGKYLRLAVLSIVRQTFPDWELLIIDDGSTDSALQSIADIGDERIRILCDGKNKGLAARLNECIDLARGKYIARMDQDDVSYPERFEQQIAALQKDSELDLVATRAITIDEGSRITGVFPSALRHDEICARPWRGFHFPHPTWMGRTAWFRDHRYTEPAPYFCEDQELLLRSYRQSCFVTLDEVLFAYRIRGETNWQKLAKTRSAVLKIKMRQFVRLNQWDFALLAMAAYLAKIVSDLFTRVRRGTLNPGDDVGDADVESKWHKVLEDLAAGET